jgi:hypothetical protein
VPRLIRSKCPLAGARAAGYGPAFEDLARDPDEPITLDALCDALDLPACPTWRTCPTRATSPGTTIADLRAVIVHLRAVIADVRAVIVHLRAVIADVRAVIVHLRAVIADVRAVIVVVRAVIAAVHTMK